MLSTLLHSQWLWLGIALFLLCIGALFGLGGIPPNEETFQNALRLGEGLGTTLLVSFIVLPVSLILGTILGLMRHENPMQAGKVATLYIEALRSIPLVLFLFFMHFGILPALGIKPNTITSSLAALCLFESAYFAEIIRGGLRAIHLEEREAAISLGLNYFQRIFFIFLPLAYQRSIPALINQVISLVKDTSLASIVGLIEFTRAGQLIYERNYRNLEIILIQALTYFIICYTLSKLSHRFETAMQPQETLELEALAT